MASRVSLLPLLLAAALLGRCAAAGSDGALTLDDATYPAFAAAHAAFVLLVYAPWCGHSRDLLPKYEEAAKMLHGEVPLAKLDGTQAEQTATLLDVKGYPTVLFLRRDGKPSEFQKTRSAAMLAEWARGELNPQIASLTTLASVHAFRKGQPVSFVMFGHSAHADDAVKAAAASTTAPCAISSLSPAEAGLDSAVSTAMVAYREGVSEAAAVLSSPPLTAERLQTFVKVEALPLVLKYSPSTEEQLFAAEVGLHLLIFHKTASPVAVDELEVVAKALRGEVAVATIDAEANQDAAEFFDADGKGRLTLPVAVAYSLVNGTKFVTSDLTSGGLLSFMRAVQRGEQEQFLRSAAEPEHAAGGVVELVGTSYARVVFDPTKDVMVNFYSSSCGHCRKLSPVYHELANTVQGDEDLVVAQIDATVNDVPGFVPEGFPTILFFPKANKAGVEYDGSRDLHDMHQFISDVRAGREQIGGIPDEDVVGGSVEGAKVEL